MLFTSSWLYVPVDAGADVGGTSLRHTSVSDEELKIEERRKDCEDDELCFR